MDKMKLAHDWAMSVINGNTRAVDAIDFVERAWAYADAMQAEADERNKAEAEQKRKEMREMLNAPNTFVERDGQHFDDVNDCEVDWSVAPKDAIGWMIFDSVSTWLGASGYLIEDAPSFGFTGTHIVERPHGF